MGFTKTPSIDTQKKTNNNNKKQADFSIKYYYESTKLTLLNYRKRPKNESQLTLFLCVRKQNCCHKKSIRYSHFWPQKERYDYSFNATVQFKMSSPTSTGNVIQCAPVFFIQIFVFFLVTILIAILLRRVNAISYFNKIKQNTFVIRFYELCKHTHFGRHALTEYNDDIMNLL